VNEVTVDEFAACVRAGSCSAYGLDEPYWNGARQSGEQWCNWGKAGRGNHPINCVDWSQANTFCGWAGKRLPTEEEWQLAAESSEGNQYPWGASEPSDQICWNGEGNSLGTGKRLSTCAVGSFPSGNSAQGVKDLGGNVWEWTETCRNSICSAGFIRGGGWYDTNPSYFGASYRFRVDPSGRSIVLGFRCARSK
jgi:formylglycine-generating enzyme required for sulfatase activity